MADFLDSHDVRVVALSRDTVAKAARHKQTDGLPFTLLSDPELAVIGQYGLVHQKGIPFVTFTVLGIPLGWPAMKIEPMAIPTTLLVDAGGVVRWIDQATDYRMRGDEVRIRDAVERCL